MKVNKLRYCFLAALKLAGYVIYPSKLNWLSKKPDSWEDVSLILILNHTSLFEFVYGVTLPFNFLKSLSQRLVIPVADKTLKSPISGFILKNLAPYTIGLTRKRDNSWNHFLSQIKDNNICIFMPEGQMKRKSGLDKNGNPMNVKTGVYDLMQRYKGKNMALVYSHGLHHVLAPGDKLPKIFKRIEADIEVLNIDDYLTEFDISSEKNIAKLVAADLQAKRDKYCKG
jgi:hypothetical protein